ncbi:30S ribosomal protein S8 [Planctomycetota bacterium]
MSMTDPIADVLTRIRNALRINRPSVKVPRSKKIKGILESMVREGYIVGFEEADGMAKQGMFRVDLKYDAEGLPVITSIQRTSKPGRRVYTSIADLRPVIKGLGISILSTSKGIISDREARKDKVGGEVLCQIW